MSKRYSNNPFVKVSSVNTHMKKLANKIVREFDGELPKGSSYKKLFDSTRIRQEANINLYNK